MAYYTERNIMNFRRYEKVRSQGLFNMFDPRARLAAELSPIDYAFVMEHYSGLKDASEAREAEDHLLQQVDHS
jgi:hypothetical protein